MPIMRLDSLLEHDVELTVEDDKGRPTTVDGVPAWTSSNDAHLWVVPTADGLGATLVPGDELNVVVRVKATADADMDDGEVRTITAELEVAIVAGEAATLELAVMGEPRPKRARAGGPAEPAPAPAPPAESSLVAEPAEENPPAPEGGLLPSAP